MTILKIFLTSIIVAISLLISVSAGMFWKGYFQEISFETTAHFICREDGKIKRPTSPIACPLTYKYRDMKLEDAINILGEVIKSLGGKFNKIENE